MHLSLVLFCIVVLGIGVMLTEILEDDRFSITSNVRGNLKGRQFIDFIDLRESLVYFYYYRCFCESICLARA